MKKKEMKKLYKGSMTKFLKLFIQIIAKQNLFSDFSFGNVSYLRKNEPSTLPLPQYLS